MAGERSQRPKRSGPDRQSVWNAWASRNREFTGFSLRDTPSRGGGQYLIFADVMCFLAGHNLK
jgi:hypothetical protein